jgi:salicylate hydroxylase
LARDAFIIVGGGIGGLAAALGLARKGRKSIVLEQASKFGEIGAGVQLAPNAFDAFDYLGIGERARNGAVFIDELVLMDAVAGGRIVGIPVGERFRARFGNPYAVVHRADLHDALLDACRDSGLVDLRVSSRVMDYDQDGSGVTANLQSGDRISGVALIGADGLWSTIRQRVVDDGPPLVAGHTTFRSVIPTEKMPEDIRWNAAVLWAGPKCHLVHYPLKDWKVFNLAITTDNGAKEPVAGQPVDVAEVHRNFPNIGDRARQIIDHGEGWRRWVLCHREPVRNWVDGRVALLGDAAHPMLQYMAQGACQAMEDAVCLAHLIEESGGDIERTLLRYNELRAPRSGRVQLTARLLGDHFFHAAGATADIRNTALHACSADDFYNSLAWLYDRAGLGIDLQRHR